MKRSFSDIDAKYFKVINADTNEEILYVREADDETGVYYQAAVDENGTMKTVKEFGEMVLLEERKQGNIHFIDIRNENSEKYIGDNLSG